MSPGNLQRATHHDFASVDPFGRGYQGSNPGRWSDLAAGAMRVIVAFASAFFAFEHERGVAILFVVSLGAFTVSLVDFAREVRIALSEFDHYA